LHYKFLHICGFSSWVVSWFLSSTTLDTESCFTNSKLGWWDDVVYCSNSTLGPWEFSL
jgi:hypothetical protein